MRTTRCVIAAIATLLMTGLTAGMAVATTLDLPPVNVMTTATFNNFQAQSLELNAQCGAAGDPRCQPFNPAQYPVQSSPGQINDELVIYQGSAGNDNTPSPFPSLPTALYDNPFRSPSGGPSTSFDMSASNEPGSGNVVNPLPEFAGDNVGTWQVRISDLLSYLNGNDLVFLFDNNQQGTLATQFLGAWGQVSITDSSENEVGGCWELSLNGGGCGTTNPSDTGGAVGTGAFVPVIGDFCVDKSTGASYRTGPTGDGLTAGNAGDCSAANNPTHPAGGYFITNNLGQSTAEFAAFNAQLNAAIHNPANADNFLTVDLKLRFLNDGDEQLWICSDCRLVPEPGLLVVLGTGLVGVGVFAARARARRKG